MHQIHLSYELYRNIYITFVINNEKLLYLLKFNVFVVKQALGYRHKNYAIVNK